MNVNEKDNSHGCGKDISHPFVKQNSRVLPALIRKVHEAKVSQAPAVEIWGSGTPKREFLHVDDMANACVYLLEKVDAPELYDDYGLSHINIGTGPLCQHRCRLK